MASIIKRRKKYSVVYSYIDENGEKKQKWETCSTYQEAQRRKTEIEHQLQTGTFEAPSVVTVDDLLRDFMQLYGVNKWALSTYTSNKAIIANYISPNIGTVKIQDVTPKFMDQFYQKLLTMPAVVRNGHKNITTISPNCVKEIHKILRCAFNQALKWEIINRNPVERATLPKVESKKREIWTAESIMKALDCCQDQLTYLCIHLAFACSMRMGEITGLTWDYVNVSDEAIANDEAYLRVEQELSRVSREAMEVLNNKDVLRIFPPLMSGGHTSLVLKLPKTASSVRTIWIPKTLAIILRDWKMEQQNVKELLGNEYQDFNLVIAQSNGRPVENRIVEKGFKEATARAELPTVVFHSLRHSSTTYKLKLSGGDIKATQGDTGHAQADMVTKVYAHILDEDRKVNAQKFEKAFYSTEPTPEPEAFKQDDTAAALMEKLQQSPELMKQMLELLQTNAISKN